MQIPIKTLHLFQTLDGLLLELLRSLDQDQWHKQTIAGKWTVKDVAGHLLDGNIRALSISRDQYFGETPGPMHSTKDLIGFLNRLNADWVQAMRRVSPDLLIELLEITCKQYVQHLNSLDPFDKAIFPVGWAGETESQNWFHIAREYTEKWHHQQQIREAVNKPGIMTRELYHPFLETFMMALPHTYRNTQAPLNTVIQITITGEAGGNWSLVKKDKWELSKDDHSVPDAVTTINGEIAWKLFSKSWRRQHALPYVNIQGNTALGDVVLDMISVMA